MPTPASAPRLDRSRHAAPQVLDDLRARIVELELAPGSVLSRAELAAHYGVSQTPVRDALNQLEEEGLVEVFAQSKTVVSRIDIAAAQASHFLRRSLEIEIARELAARPDATLMARLRAIVAEQKAHFGRRDYAAMAAADRAFHREMYVAAGMAGLFATILRHSGHIDRLRRLHLPTPGKGKAILDDHARIVRAIAAGDVAAAERCVREHLSGTLAHADEMRRLHPALVTN